VEVAPEPLAAALGAGLEVAAARAGIVVDVGEGVTDCALLRGGSVAASDALRVAVADLRAAIREWTSECLGVRISPVEAERVLREVGVARETLRPQRTLRVVGRPRQGLGPVRIELEVDAALAAVAPVAERIEAHVGRFLAGLPTESRETEVCVSGGGALLPGLLERLEERTQRRIRRAPDPVRSVIDGARRIAAGAAGL
jgi:rod shape-determining protein MreB